MKKYLLLFFFFLSQFCFAQNLVPNYSFEQYDTCPTNGDQIQYAAGWSKYSATTTTPDYYNTCSSPTAQGVPQHFWGFHTEHRGCSAYAGIGIYSITLGYREDIGIQLSQPLIIGQQYFISFYTVFGVISNSGYYYSMPSNNIGMRLSTIAYSGTNPAPTDNFAHLHSVAIISDSINWTLIAGSIIADSAYSHLIIGNFFDNVNTDTLHLNCDSCFNYYSYYYVDDICVSTDSLLCNGGIAELPCITTVNEIIFPDGINLFPNPTSDFVTLSFQNIQNAELLLYDIFGRKILADTVRNKSKMTIDISSLSSGTYFLKIINNKTVTKKIIKL